MLIVERALDVDINTLYIHKECEFILQHCYRVDNILIFIIFQACPQQGRPQVEAQYARQMCIHCGIHQHLIDIMEN